MNKLVLITSGDRKQSYLVETASEPSQHRWKCSIHWAGPSGRRQLRDQLWQDERTARLDLRIGSNCQPASRSNLQT